jgi:hypothetical protein
MESKKVTRETAFAQMKWNFCFEDGIASKTNMPATGRNKIRVSR